MVTKEGVSGTKHFYWVQLYGTTVFFIDLRRIPVTPKGFCWKSTRQQGLRVNPTQHPGPTALLLNGC